MLYCERKGVEFKQREYDYGSYDVKRDDPIAVQVVRELGAKANGVHANISIATVFEEYPVGMYEYDGTESVSPTYKSCFVDFVNKILFESLTDSEKIMLMRQKKRDIEWAQKVYREMMKDDERMRG